MRLRSRRGDWQVPATPKRRRGLAWLRSIYWSTNWERALLYAVVTGFVTVLFYQAFMLGR